MPESEKAGLPKELQPPNVPPGGAFVEFDVAEIERSIPERFEKVACNLGDHPAIESQGQAFSYRQLNEAVNRLAWAILRYQGKRSRPIVIIAEHGAGGIVAMLAILKAGGIYLPLDAAFPSARLKHMFQDSKAALILADGKNLRAAEELSTQKVGVLNMDDLDPDLSMENPGLYLAPSRLASILYTTGSTGQPKGVVQNHRNLLHLAKRYGNSYRLRVTDRIALLRSLSVSGGTLHTLGALLNGATLLPFDVRREGLAALAEWLKSSRATLCSLGPRTMRDLAAVRDAGPYTNVRRLTLSGEPLYRDDIDRCKKLFFPECVVINSLGATEAPLAAQYVIDAKTKIETSLIPVGFAARGFEILLCDEDGGPVRDGETGEIIIKSRYLALGYWRNRELTRQKFLHDPTGEDRIYRTGDIGKVLPDGALVHLGRKDDLEKIRGYKVGVLEVEQRLREHPHVREAAVTAWVRKNRESYLAGYIVAEVGKEITVTDLVAFLRERLPDYMVPSVFSFLSSLPQINGKVDRRALPPPEGIRPRLASEYREAANEIENELVQIWQNVLEIRPIGTADNFFEVGGHSLAAMRIVSEIITRFRLQIPLQSLFQAPTIAEMAEVITQSQSKELDDADLRCLLSELESMADDEAKKLLDPRGS